MVSIVPVVLCGGSGSRLWPLSRKSMPKQFAPLIGNSSLFTAAVQRSALLTSNEPVVVTSVKHRFLVEKQLRDVGLLGKILLEPVGKNTAPAIFAAAYHVQKVYGDALMLVMPSDHHIPDHERFREMVRSGMSAALDNSLITFGVTPERPETGYGYIEVEGDGDKVCSPVKKFYEKPQVQSAKQMIAQGNCFWNAGIFLFKASTVLKCAEQLETDAMALIKISVDAAVKDNNFLHLDSASWGEVKAVSFDNAILERINQIKCVKFDGSWLDLGDWKALGGQLPLDGDGNSISGEASQIDCKNVTLWSASEGTHLVGLGLSNIVAVVVDDAVLITESSRTQDVRKVVDYLDANKISQAEFTSKSYRPWGWFESLVNRPGYQVKRLHVHSGAALSIQSHEYRSEHWVVVSGTATVLRGDKTLKLEANESVYIEVGQKHRLANDTSEPLTVIEVQTGTYLGEDDIVRYDDRYNRLANE